MSRDISEPQVFGPGLWYSVHLLARQAITPEKKLQFIEYMNLLKKRLPCVNCRTHCAAYISEHPFDIYWNLKENGQDIGMFKWSFEFHNAVNQRLGKPVLAWSVALTMYIENGVEVCIASCGDGASGSQAAISKPLVSQSKMIIDETPYLRSVGFKTSSVSSSKQKNKIKAKN